MHYTFQKSLGRITQQVSKGLGRVLEKKFKDAGYSINSAQWTAISFLTQKGELSQSDISKFMGVNKVMVKRILDQLEESGIAKRAKARNDKRFNKIILTRKGHSLYKELTPYAEKTLEEAYSGFDPNEIEHCIHTLSKIADRLEKL